MKDLGSIVHQAQHDTDIVSEVEREALSGEEQRFRSLSFSERGRITQENLAGKLKRDAEKKGIQLTHDDAMRTAEAIAHTHDRQSR